VLVLLGLFALAVTPAVAMAQTETGRLTGRVIDEQGAVRPGVTVTVKAAGSQAGGRTIVTDDTGTFTFTTLQPGDYDVTAQATGFRTWQSKVVIPIGGTVTLEVKLPVGGVTERIEVESRISQVNLKTQEVITRVNADQIANLPTITRNPYDLVALAGNVSAGDPVNDGAVLFRGVGFAINGQRTASVNVLLDGSANNDEFTSAVGQSVPLDSVQEFSVISSSFSAQYGRAGGGIVNVATKSGSNVFHGKASTYYRSSALSALNFDNKERGLPKGDFTRHQPGFSLGGPIERDRMYFFSSYESIRVRSTDQLLTFVPTAEFLNLTSPTTRAFFNAFPLATGINGPVITRGEITATRPGGPFSAIPAGTPIFGQVQQDVPIDAGGGTPQNTHLWNSRVDFNLTSNTTAYVRYALEKIDWLAGTNSQSPYAGFSSGFNAFNHNVLFSLAHVFSPRMVSQSKFVFNRLKNEQGLGDAPAGPTLYMLPGAAPRLSGVRIGFPGYLPFSPGSAIPFGGPQNLFQLYQDIHWLKGEHDFQFGGSFVRIHDNRTFGAYMNAVEVLGSSVGEALDNLVTGDLIRFQVAIDPQGKFPGDSVTLPVGFPNFTRNNRYNEWAVYASDAWRMSNRFTLNLGVRYEYFGVQHNADPSLDANFYYGPGATIPEQLRNGAAMRAIDSPVGGLWEPDYNNIAPRVGFAWDINGDGRTSLRGGYGIGYERNFGNVTFNVLFNPPNYAVVTLTPQDVGRIPITTDNAGPFAGSAGTQKVIPASSMRHVDQNIETAYAHFWSLSFQRELGHSTVASVEYTGSAGRKLYDLSDYNKVGGGTIFFGDANVFSRPNNQFSFFNTRGNRGHSMYNGVILGLNVLGVGKTGLSLGGKYTFSVARDNLSSTFSEGQNSNNLGYIDAFDPDLDYGFADFDVRHRASGNFIWSLPFARGTTGMKNTLLAGWQVQGIFSAQSGTPFSIFDCTNNLGVFCMRMLEVAPIDKSGPRDPAAVAGEPNRFIYLDLVPQHPGVGTYVHPLLEHAEFGPYPANMTKRNAFRGPGRWSFDAALSKDFSLTSGRRLQFRLEVYNVFNHANLYILSGEVYVDSQDYIPASRGLDPLGRDQRRVQLGFSYIF
jgi:outer membrane receptor protein involved in Fe transport